MLQLGHPYVRGNGDVIENLKPNDTTPALQGQFAMLSGSTLVPSDGTKAYGVASFITGDCHPIILTGIDVGVRGEAGLSGLSVGETVYVSANGLMTNDPTTGLRIGVLRKGVSQMATVDGEVVDDCYLIRLDKATLDTAPAQFRASKASKGE